MEKYIIIDTWNGEGYTDSDAEIIERNSFEEALQYAEEKAKSNDNVTFEDGNRYQHGNMGEDGELIDSGSYHVVEYTGQYGIAILPDENTFVLFDTEDEYMSTLENDLETLQEDEDEVKALQEDKEGAFHNDYGCCIYQKLIDEDYEDVLTKQNVRIAKYAQWEQQGESFIQPTEGLWSITLEPDELNFHEDLNHLRDAILTMQQDSFKLPANSPIRQDLTLGLSLMNPQMIFDNIILFLEAKDAATSNTENI